MSRRIKIAALCTFALAVVFANFFQTSKHLALFANVNPFAEDPYDAVGSFAVQLAPFTALLALLRAFRPFQSGQIDEAHPRLFLRAAMLSCISVAVTLAAYVVGLLRHIPTWITHPAGLSLAAWLGAIALLTFFVIWLLCRSVDRPFASVEPHPWLMAICVCIIGILVLTVYPENWRVNLHGALLTIFVGILYFFGLTWAIARALFPAPVPLVADFLDDLLAIYQWVEANLGFIRRGLHFLDRLVTARVVRPVWRWLNPRVHVWTLPVALGFLIGALLLLAEMFAEGGGLPQARQLVLVASIYVGVEIGGVLLGYALLASPLGLFRHVAQG